MEPGGGRGVKLVGLREAMSSEQALWCLEGLALSVQRGSEAVGCLEHRGFSRGCLGCPRGLRFQWAGSRHSLGMLPPGLTCSSTFTNSCFLGFFCFCDKTVIAGQIEIKTRSLECA